MTPEQERHLSDIKREFTGLVDRKYRAGQAEHGGNLWDVRVMRLIDNAIDEAVDQVVYLLTIRRQLELMTSSMPGPGTPVVLCGAATRDILGRSHTCALRIGHDGPHSNCINGTNSWSWTDQPNVCAAHGLYEGSYCPGCFDPTARVRVVRSIGKGGVGESLDAPVDRAVEPVVQSSRMDVNGASGDCPRCPSTHYRMSCIHPADHVGWHQADNGDQWGDDASDEALKRDDRGTRRYDPVKKRD